MDRLKLDVKNIYSGPRKELETLSARFGNKLVGEITMSIFRHDIESLVIENLYILPESRNKGFATKILLTLVESCKGTGITKLKLIVDFDNEPAQKLYKKLGFMYKDGVLDFCYRMEKSL